MLVRMHLAKSNYSNVNSCVHTGDAKSKLFPKYQVEKAILNAKTILQKGTLIKELEFILVLNIH